MNLTMVGTGYVGLVTGSCFANTGNNVTCLDIDERKIADLNRGKCPIYEPGLVELMHRNTGRMTFTTDKQLAYGAAEVIFICVGTVAGPDGAPDLSAVMGRPGRSPMRSTRLRPMHRRGWSSSSRPCPWARVTAWATSSGR